ncbi:MAG: polysaccharide deacetylase family protein [Proteobacteria bacterium]|nr:polysaccharide deacetylase family protein [Pseudomonadota bacterium]
MHQRMLKNAIGFLVLASGLGWLIRNIAARGKVSILVYHDPKPEVLHRHLQHLNRAYNIIPPSRYFEALKAKDFSTLPPRSLVMTFDDGHVGNAALVQVMHAHGVKGLIYLCSHIVDTQRGFWWQSAAAKNLGISELKKLTDADRLAKLAEYGFERDADQGTAAAVSLSQIKSLSQVFEFGSHTCYHPILTQCNDAACDEEIAASKRKLESLLNQPVLHFAFPNGNYGQREIAMIKAAGYETARTIDVGWNGALTDPFHLKVLEAADDATVWWLRAQLTGATTLFKNAVRYRRISLALQQGDNA